MLGFRFVCPYWALLRICLLRNINAIYSLWPQLFRLCIWCTILLTVALAHLSRFSRQKMLRLPYLHLTSTCFNKPAMLVYWHLSSLRKSLNLENPKFSQILDFVDFKAWILDILAFKQTNVLHAENMDSKANQNLGVCWVFVLFALIEPF